jgi:hypothetical protein
MLTSPAALVTCVLTVQPLPWLQLALRVWGLGVGVLQHTHSCALPWASLQDAALSTSWQTAAQPAQFLLVALGGGFETALSHDTSRLTHKGLVAGGLGAVLSHHTHL